MPDAITAPQPAASLAAGREWCALAAASPAFAKALAPLSKATTARTAKSKRKPAALEHVSPAAHAFATGMVLHSIASGPPRRVWILASDLRAQEALSSDLATWWGPTLFFPEAEEQRVEGSLPDEETSSERLAILERLSHPPASIEVFVVHAASLAESVPAPSSLASQSLTIQKGQVLSMASVTQQLEAAGYDRSGQVGERGQFAVRGGIIDVYSWQADLPLRIEWFGEEIDSLRRFDPDSQISVGRESSASILLHSTSGTDTASCLLSDCIDPADLVIAADLETCPRADVWITEGVSPLSTKTTENFSTACHAEPAGTFDAGDFVMLEARRKSFADQLCRWHADHWRVVMFFNNEGEIERFRELLASEGIEHAHLEFAIGRVTRGFTAPTASLAVLCDAEIFGRYQHSRARRLVTAQRRQRQRKIPLDLSGISDGEFVVHQEYGIGRYRGLIRRTHSDGSEEDVVVIEYADDARLYVPLPQAYLIGRYVGLGKKTPDLSSLGDGRWNKSRQQAERAIFAYAEKLLEIHAARETAQGFPHPPDNRWQGEFESSFLYRETTDQLRAIDDTKRDMEGTRPMDRLICGDVGFGKTEVAIRAAFKAVMSGKQVAILAPTTVLSQQHYHNFRERMSDYPVRVDVLNRFRSTSESRKVTEQLLSGSIDIIVGTHRLISKDVAFKDLGLVVIDEEQRFGVKHKERFKELFRSVDVLTLSATPIPRTLYMALMGARDMSTIDTPPPNRSPVETVICAYDERVIKKAIERELHRKGQVFFLYNRVGSIERMVEKLLALSPKGTTIEAGHGQMEEGQLEEVMNRFVSGQTDILVCTTIIESGIDIPNANTIIIDRADRFGLADLYQLRGRVGRAGHKAYAYLMIPRSEMTGGDARKRINAMKQYTALGSGFRIAMRDLEIRGAGNLLGTQQSGHMAAVGFEMYCRMLKASVAKLKGQRVPGRIETSLAIDFAAFSEAELRSSNSRKIPAFIPESWIPGPGERIPAYRQLAEVTSLKDLTTLITEWKDRFGPPPDAVSTLWRCTELRLHAHRAGCSAVEIRGDRLMLSRNGDFIVIDGRFPRLNHKSPPAARLLEAIALVRQL